MLDRRELLRRGLLAAGAAAMPQMLAAQVKPAADWTLGLIDVAGDIAPRPLSRLHGKAPTLSGTLYRNGPARFRRGASSVTHWFDGDGLVRAWRIAGERASLAARFVDTPSGGSKSGSARSSSPVSARPRAPAANWAGRTMPTPPTPM